MIVEHQCPELSNLPDLLSATERSVAELGKGYEQYAEQLGGLRERLAEGRFHLAILGQFKRGKSTLINALLGEAVLPTAVVPLTAIPTFIRPGRTRSARVIFLDRREPQNTTARTAQELRDFLTGFVTEAGNPKNQLGIEQVEVFHPAAMLSRGVVLIDTPGIGSTFHHNTETTLNFLPKCDAALFLVSADPPITAVEVEFLREVYSRTTRLFFILNKADYLSDEERRAALDFLRKVLTEQVDLSADAPIFCVSARQGLEARTQRDNALWETSGLAQVERHLIEFLVQEKNAALSEAIGHKATDTLSKCLMQLHFALRSLQMPLEELQKRLRVFETHIETAQKQRIAAGDLLAGDRRRMREFLEEHAGQLREKASEFLKQTVHEVIGRNGLAGEADIQAALAEVIPGYFERRTNRTTELFRQRMTQILQPHQQRADELIESVRKAAVNLFDLPDQAPESQEAFRLAEQPYWVTHKWSSMLSPIHVGLLDKLLPVTVRQKRILDRLLEQVNELVAKNVENLRWVIFQSIDQAFIQFGSMLDQRLADTVAATHGAIRATMDRRCSQSMTVAGETSQIEAAIAKLKRLQSMMARFGR